MSAMTTSRTVEELKNILSLFEPLFDKIKAITPVLERIINEKTDIIGPNNVFQGWELADEVNNLVYSHGRILYRRSEPDAKITSGEMEALDTKWTLITSLLEGPDYKKFIESLKEASKIVVDNRLVDISKSFLYSIKQLRPTIKSHVIGNVGGRAKGTKTKPKAKAKAIPKK